MFYLLLLYFQPLLIAEPALTLERQDHWLVIRGKHLPSGSLKINYLEAYCRAGSTKADWINHTVIPHRSELLSRKPDGTQIELRDTLADGLVVNHLITAGTDEISFTWKAKNPTSKVSEAHWAQPCVRLGSFTGFRNELTGNLEDYLPQCFIFLDGKLSRMPTRDRARQARYTPGQVWKGPQIPETDVNPRPVSKLIPSHGLIGCFSADEKLIFAIAAEPYQELFQGVARCLHVDFRLGGLLPGEEKTVRGKIYLMKNDVSALLKRYEKDFPEHRHLSKH